jgi:hypothetical protein
MKEQWAVVLGTSTLVCFKDNATSHNIKITVPLVEVSCTACFVVTVSVHSGQFGKVTVPYRKKTFIAECWPVRVFQEQLLNLPVFYL